MKIFIILLVVMQMNMAFANSLKQVFVPQIQLENNAIVLTVISNGCTKKKDFSIDLNDLKIQITRIKKDYCRAKSHLVKFYFSFKDLGLQKPFKLI